MEYDCSNKTSNIYTLTNRFFSTSIMSTTESITPQVWSNNEASIGKILYEQDIKVIYTNW